MIRSWVLAPLLHISNGKQPRALRKVEMLMTPDQIKDLESTLAVNNRDSVIEALENTIRIYGDLRDQLFGKEVQLRKGAEQKSMEYLEKLNRK